MPAPKQKLAYQYKTIGDQKVKPVLFDGKAVGQGKFMAAEFEGNGGLVRGKDGLPLKYGDIT